jgi:hypothetical protein
MALCALQSLRYNAVRRLPNYGAVSQAHAQLQNMHQLHSRQQPFSSSSSGPQAKRPLDEEENVHSSQQGAMGMIAKLGPHARTAASVVGGGTVLYGISRILYDVAEGFMGLTPAVSLKYGFGFGLISAGTAAAMGFYLERAMNAKPEIAFGLAMRAINADESLRTLVGGKAEFSQFDIKTYKSRGGSLGLVNGRLTWKAPRVELMFSTRAGGGGSGHLMGNEAFSGTHVNVLAVVEQRLFTYPLVEFCGVDVVSDASRSQRKRTRLVLTTVDSSMERDHFAIMDRMGVSLEAMRRSQLQ